MEARAEVSEYSIQVRLTLESNLLHVPICFWSMGIGDCITLFWGH